MSRVVLVTGATGFVGSALIPVLSAAGWSVRATIRRPEDAARLPVGAAAVAVGELSPTTDWGRALEGVSAVVHLAARAHRPRDGRESEAEYMAVNAGATAALARAARASGVGRLVFLSSVRAAGDAGEGLDERAASPTDAYGRSKIAAEAALTAESGLSSCALRAPLCYGPGVKANFLGLMRAVARGVPLPLGAARNRRSFLFVGNLADAATRLLSLPEARGAFMIRDAEDLAVADLVRRLGAALGTPARLWAVPAPLLRAALSLAGRGGSAESLLGVLTVNDAKLRALGWAPPYTTGEGLARTARWYHSLR